MFKIIISITCYTLLASMLSACATIQPPKPEVYQQQILDEKWLFQKSDHQANTFNVNAQNWQSVSLPHTANIENKVILKQWQGLAFYQKTFQVSQTQQEKLIYLTFDAAMNKAEVWLNGKKLGVHHGGYLPFSFNITQDVIFGKNNTLLVRLDNRDSEITGPKPVFDLDFNMYGGLYRSVKLEFKPKLHITDPVNANKVASGGIFIQPVLDPHDLSSARLNIQTHIDNQSLQSQQFIVRQTLLFKEQFVQQTQNNYHLEAGEQQNIKQAIQIQAPKLWHPHTPHLYQLVTELRKGSDLLQKVTHPVGFRHFEFTANHQLMINGKQTFLRGVNYHQDYPYIGYAKSPQAEYRDAVLIKSAGFDFVRLSHYPHSPEFLKAADELGLVLLNPFLGWQYYQDTAEFKQNAFQRCRDLIRRDRNHPSIIAWECSLNETTMPAPFIAELDKIVNQEIPLSYSAGWQEGYDIYIQARQHTIKHPDQTPPAVPYLVSEYGDWEYYRFNAGKNQPNWFKLPEEARFSRQLISAGEQRLLQQATNLQEAYIDNSRKHPIADAYWVMFDYNRGKFNNIESSGIASIDRLPKFSYYFYQSQRSPSINLENAASGPMVYIASDWQVGSNPKVRVYSNTDKVALYLDDQLIATHSPSSETEKSVLPHPPLTFDLRKFSAGTLTAKGFINNKQVAMHQVSTPAQAVGLSLNVATEGVALAENDTIFIHAQLVDAKGHPTYDNDVPIRFSINGDGTIINPENASGVLTTKGQAGALIKVGKNLAGLNIQASVLGRDIHSPTLPLAPTLPH